jgi:hypothetical protein
MWHSRYGLSAIVLALLVILPATVQGEENDPAKPEQSGYGPKTEEERIDADLIRQEDARELQKSGEPVLTTLEGKLYLLPEANESALPWVIGRFSVQGRAHLLLLDTAEVFTSLKALNGKVTKLSGRTRLGGKYFIATSVYVPVKVPSSPPKRGGM